MVEALKTLGIAVDHDPSTLDDLESRAAAAGSRRARRRSRWPIRGPACGS